MTIQLLFFLFILGLCGILITWLAYTLNRANEIIAVLVDYIEENDID